MILAYGLAFMVRYAMTDSSSELMSQASNAFSNRLYNELAQEEGNLLVCPLSLHVSLGLVHHGAGGRTAQELASTLYLDASNNGVKEGYRKILTDLKSDVLSIVTKLYPQAGYQLNGYYTNIAKEYFLSEIESLDYSDADRAAKTINRYVEDHTGNKIHNLIDPNVVGADTKLIIVNAVHFKAEWVTHFDDSYDYVFHVSSTNKVRTTLMSQTNWFGYKEDPVLEAQVLKMDYKDGDFSMLFILPNQLDGLPALEDKLASTRFTNILKDFEAKMVYVTIPKFRIEKTLDLKGVLQKMGINDMFTGAADLRNITEGDGLMVSDVIQKTFINVHEKGTEAAAATAILAVAQSAMGGLKYFRADRPFHFILFNGASKNILFRGRFVNPN